MARKSYTKTVPTNFDNYLACETLILAVGKGDLRDLYTIIGGYVLNKPIDPRLTLNLRKRWLKLLKLGLTESQVDELLNS